MSSISSRDIKKISRLKKPWQIAILVVLVGLTVWFDYKKDRTGAGENNIDQVVSRGVTSGTCVNVIDGDTLDVLTDSGETIRIRLLGIDCMETHNELKMAEQAEQHGRSVEQIRLLGERAKAELRDFALNAPVEWEIPRGTPIRDPYGRVLAYVSVEGEDVGEFQLRNGLAEVRRDEHPRADRYKQAAQPLVQ